MPDFEIIEPPVQPVSSNLVDYKKEYTTFSWEKVRGELSGLPGKKGLNIAYEAVDRHVEILNDQLQHPDKL